MDRFLISFSQNIGSTIFAVGLLSCASQESARTYHSVTAQAVDLKALTSKAEKQHASEDKRWALEELIAFALANQKEGWDLDRSQMAGALSASTQLANPELRLGASGLEPHRVDDKRYDLDFKVRYKPNHPAALYYQHQEASWDKEVGEAEIEIERRELIYNIKKLFLKIKFAELKKQNFEDSTVENSISGSTDVINVSILEEQNKQLESTIRLEQSKTQLQLLVGIPHHNRFEIEFSEDSKTPWIADFSSDQFAEYIVQTHPLAWALESKEKAKDAKIGQERLKQFPWISFFDFEKRYEEKNEDKGGWEKPWSFQFGIDIPVFSFNLGKISEIQAEFEKSKWKKKTEMEKLALEARMVFEMYQLRAQQFEKIQKAVEALEKKDSPLEKKELKKAQKILFEIEEQYALEKINMERILGHEVEKLNQLIKDQSP